ncbi:MAG TPA: diphthine--ammonia ligase [Verrucomicrobiae bacterium]
MTDTANPAARDAAVLWTGGKDSALALHEARQLGWNVRCLVTFAPPEPDFLAHPVAVMKLQAEALGLPHWLWPVHAPFEERYEAGLRWLQKTQRIDTVITGDIAEVGGAPNWIRERSRPLGMNVLTPLWGRDRLTLLQQLLEARFAVVFSCIKTRWLTPEWVGRQLDETSVSQLRALRERNGIDLCGEEGEYHTLVTDAPGFRQRVHFGAAQVCERDALAYLKIESAELRPKP